MTTQAPTIPPPERPWYAEVTRYQWMVLVIASAGWVFDVFEGQLFNITRQEMLGEMLGRSGAAGEAARRFWGDVFLAVFLLGGTVGGIVFGNMADRFGRKPVMAVTIRSEEHTSELQSQSNLVCRLLLEKKKKKKNKVKDAHK